MGYYLSEPAPSKGDPTAKNRVWGFFGESVSVSLETRRAALETHRENYGESRKTASGIPLWPSRDPIQESGGVNLYGFVGNDGVNEWDLFGFSSSGAGEWDYKKCDCCCAEDIDVEFVDELRLNGEGDWGHDIKTIFRTSNGTTASPLDSPKCNVKWEEKTNKPYTENMVANEWNDMGSDPETSDGLPTDGFMAPGNGILGRGKYIDNDFPSLNPRGPNFTGSGKRTLEIRITLTSAAGCPCAKDSIEVKLVQTLIYANGRVPFGSLTGAGKTTKGGFR